MSTIEAKNDNLDEKMKYQSQGKLNTAEQRISESKLDQLRLIAQQVITRRQQSSSLQNFVANSPLPNISAARKSERDEIDFLSYKPEAVKSTRRCGNCKGNNVLGIAVGGRSSDEAVPVQYTCMDCSFNWKSSG